MQDCPSGHSVHSNGKGCGPPPPRSNYMLMALGDGICLGLELSYLRIENEAAVDEEVDIFE